jgi:hypothetical protein
MIPEKVEDSIKRTEQRRRQEACTLEMGLIQRSSKQTFLFFSLMN